MEEVCYWCGASKENLVYNPKFPDYECQKCGKRMRNPRIIQNDKVEVIE